MLRLLPVPISLWWLLLGQGISLPTESIISSSSSAIRSSSRSSNIQRDNAGDGSIGSGPNLVKYQSSSSTKSIGSIDANDLIFEATRNISDTTISGETSGTYSSTPITGSASSQGNHVAPPTSRSTRSGYSPPTTPRLLTSTNESDYALSFAELLSALTAEFVFNVAGDHVLFPVTPNLDEDRRLHTSATVVAELLQKLHLTAQVYRILNITAFNVAEDMWMSKRRRNPVAEVMRLTVDALVQDPQLRDEYLAAKHRVANQIYSLPSQHGKFASDRSQTLYDVRPEQLAYAERLMEDARVKKLVMSVTFFKGSQFEEVSVPMWVRSQTNLAKAVFQLVQNPKWRDEVQRLFDETLGEIADRYDAMGGDDEAIFQKLSEKFEEHLSLNAELKAILKSNRSAETKT